MAYECDERVDRNVGVLEIIQPNVADTQVANNLRCLERPATRDFYKVPKESVAEKGLGKSDPDVGVTYVLSDEGVTHGIESDLQEFAVKAITRGIDAIGEVTARVRAEDGRVYVGRGSDTDIIVSSAKAYLNAINRMIDASRTQRAHVRHS